MRSSKLPLLTVLLSAALLGAYWVVAAQEGRSLFAPPEVVPANESSAPAPNAEKTAKPREKAKADLSPIVQASAQQSAATKKVVPIERVPEPVFPGATMPPPTIPLPAPVETIKMPLVEPMAKEPLPELSLPPPVVIPEEKRGPAIPPPVPATPTEPTDPKPAPAIIPPPLVPEMPKVPVAPTEPTNTARTFERIRPESSIPPPMPPPQTKLNPVVPQPPGEQKPIVPPPVAPQPVGVSGGLMNLQTPSVSIEKHGPKIIRAREAIGYQLVVRNLGPGVAQQIRIEEDLPAGVKLVAAEPMPTMVGNKAVFYLSAMNVGQEQTIRLTLQANADAELTGPASVHVAALMQTTTTAPRPQNNDAPQPMIEFTGPPQVAVGKQIVFDIRVANPSSQPLTNIVLHGLMPAGLTTPQGDNIFGKVDGAIAPGDFRILKMPATAIKPGQFTVKAKVVTNVGEVSATTNIEITQESLVVQQAPTTRLAVGRDGTLQFEVTNNSGKPLRNVTVADRLPEGVDYAGASNSGLYQANSRTVYWLITNMPAGATQNLAVRVNGAKPGQHQNVVYAKADGVSEIHTASTVFFEGTAELNLRVSNKDQVVEQGRDTTYEIVVQNPGSAIARNVQLQVQLSPGLQLKNANGKTRHTVDRQTITFASIASLEAKGQATYRVTVTGQVQGDQRARFAIVSDQVREPIQHEVSTRVVER